jgi:hypothetical protein
MKKRLIFLLVFVFIFSMPIVVQAATEDPEIEWSKILGGSGSEDVLRSIQQTNDGGYIVSGYSSSNSGDVTRNHGGFDYWVVKLESNREIEWQKCLGGSSYDNATNIRQTSDGGYVIGGFSNSNNGDVPGNHGGHDFWIVKLYSETETLVDTTPPTIVAPANIIIEAASADGAEVSSAATATDDVGPVTITYTSDPGTIFPQSIVRILRRSKKYYCTFLKCP